MAKIIKPFYDHLGNRYLYLKEACEKHNIPYATLRRRLAMYQENKPKWSTLEVVFKNKRKKEFTHVAKP